MDLIVGNDTPEMHRAVLHNDIESLRQRPTLALDRRHHLSAHGVGIVAAGEVIDNIAEFGVVFLMFSIGLEFSLQRLKAMRLLVFGFGIAALEIAIPYHRYARILRWLCLSLVSYLIVLLIVNVAWSDLASRLFVPHLGFERPQIAALIAIFGTTISPYLFFWQTAEEVEELNDGGASGPPSREQLVAMRGDVIAGMSSGVVAMFAIMVTAAATLHAEGITTIGTADEAASALEPLAGRLAGLVFSLGIVGTGLLAVPVLAGSTSYAIAETFGWREGLSLRLSQARAFYGVIVASMVAGVAMNLFGLDPVRALYWSAILNGLAAPPLIVIIFLLARRRNVLGEHASGRLSQATVVAAAVLSAALPLLYLLAR